MPGFFCGGDEQTRTKTQRFTQVQDARRLTALLLHVWIDIIIMVETYKGVLGVNPAGYLSQQWNMGFP